MEACSWRFISTSTQPNVSVCCCWHWHSDGSSYPACYCTCHCWYALCWVSSRPAFASNFFCSAFAECSRYIVASSLGSMDMFICKSVHTHFPMCQRLHIINEWTYIVSYLLHSHRRWRLGISGYGIEIKHAVIFGMQIYQCARQQQARADSELRIR